MPQLLATFIHVSDLHIGDIDPATGDAAVSPRMAQVFANNHWLDGLLGHHGQALEELEAFCEDLRDAGEAPRLLVTGDATRAGAATELDTARAFLEQAIDLSPPLQRHAGLRLGRFGNTDFIIAGNHDHWGGTPPPAGGNASLAWARLSGTAPAVHAPALRLANGRDVVFVCIDSDADVAARTLDRTLAKGSFRSQLADPASQPGAATPGEIRVMLIHHSWAQSGPWLRMKQGSRQALAEHLYTHGVQVMLSGHSHVPLLRDFVVSTRHGSRTVFELRCGTTTQHDTVPLSWLNLVGRRPKRQWPPNALLVHRLWQAADGGTEWEATVHVRSLKSGFVPLPGTAGVRRFPV
jgi:3',5'-cyclic AMP phosphodiesterase CpdA